VKTRFHLLINPIAIVQEEESSNSKGKFAGSSSSTNILSDLSSTSNFNPSTSTRISSSKHVQNDQHANTINDLSSTPLYKEVQMEEFEEKTEMDAVNSEDLSFIIISQDILTCFCLFLTLL
jgi:hypothetical protein